MKISFAKIAVQLCILLASGLTATRGAIAAMSGAAELAYIKFDGEADGKKDFSGTTFAQNYQIAYRATNLAHRAQPRYYALKLGYDWKSFDTSADFLGQSLDVKQTYGKFQYAGEFGFTAANLPIRVHAYINDDQPILFRYSLGRFSLINDGLITAIEGRGKFVSSGASLVFSPEFSNDPAIRTLPRLLLDYRETVSKSTEGFFQIDNRTREIAVAGLNQKNNWLHYRRAEYENFLDGRDNYIRQQLQIGLIDQLGDRKWSALTNWIEVSADGQLTNTKSPSPDVALEEYDLNFMAIATRRLWSARTFMNYNRQIDDTGQTETARLPLYVKGIYGAESDWYLSLAALRERQRLISDSKPANSSSNSFTAGGTTFSRSSFTLSPSVSLQTTRDINGIDSYYFSSSLETSSTRRFSDKLGLGARITFRGADDGLGNEGSKTWSTLADFTHTYTARSYNYKLQETMEIGNGNGYLSGSRLLYGSGNSSKVGTYLRNYLAASLSWTPTARFSSYLGASYEFLESTGLRPTTNTNLFFQTSYNNQDVSYRYDMKYLRSQNGYDSDLRQWINNAEVQYRPNRYHDGLFRLTHENDQDLNQDQTTVEVLQRYIYNMFTRTGVVRNIASLSQEYDYKSYKNFGIKSSSQYLMFTGRYNPTDRLSLYGSVRYETSDPGGATTMFYNAGMSADFKLLSATLDYAYARRDTDNRIEKRLSTSLRRTF